MRAFQGINRALAAVFAWAIASLHLPVPRTPAVVKFNEHPFARRTYGKVVAGGMSALDAVRGFIRGVTRAVASVGQVLRPALAVLALLATMLALEAVGSGVVALASPAVVLSSKSLRQHKAALLSQARSITEDAKRKEQAVDEDASATDEDKQRARANTERARETAKTFLVQAEEMDSEIEFAERLEAQEAEMGRSQGRRAGGQNSDPDHPPVSQTDQSFDDEFRSLSAKDRQEVAQRYLLAAVAGKGDQGRMVEFASRHFGEDDLATRALSTSTVEEGAAIVPETLSTELIEFLRPMSAVRRLNPIVLPLASGKLSIPKLTGGAVAGYIGENDNAPKTQQVFGNLNLVFRKLAALIPVSNDLIRYANRQVNTMVRDDTVSALRDASDPKFIRGPGTENAPKGLRYWAPAGNVIAANNTVNLANVTEDLGKLILALEEANVRMLRPGWIFAPRTKHYLMTVRDGNGNYAFRDEMLAGTLWGFPFSSSTNVPKNLGGGTESEVYLADYADVVIGEAPNIGLQASDTAAYHDGSSVQAAFSRDQTVLRAIQEHDFGMRHAESVAVLNEVTWGA